MLRTLRAFTRLNPEVLRTMLTFPTFINLKGFDSSTIWINLSQANPDPTRICQILQILARICEIWADPSPGWAGSEFHQIGSEPDLGRIAEIRLTRGNPDFSKIWISTTKRIFPSPPPFLDGLARNISNPAKIWQNPARFIQIPNQIWSRTDQIWPEPARIWPKPTSPRNFPN